MTLTWKINQLEAYPQAEGQENVVFTAHWDLVGQEGEYTGRVYGSAGITYEAGTPFTPFNELTEEVVVGWVKAALGEEAVAAYEAAVAKQIEDQKNPAVVTPPLPWAPVAEVPAE